MIEEYEAAGKWPFNIADEIYRVRPERLSEAQHVATKRASLQQKGLVFCSRRRMATCMFLVDGPLTRQDPQSLADSRLRESWYRQ